MRLGWMEKRSDELTFLPPPVSLQCLPLSQSSRKQRHRARDLQPVEKTEGKGWGPALLLADMSEAGLGLLTPPPSPERPEIFSACPQTESGR